MNTGKNTTSFKKSEAAAPSPSCSWEGKLLSSVEAFDVLACTCNSVVKELGIADAAHTTLNPMNPAFNWIMYVA